MTFSTDLINYATLLQEVCEKLRTVTGEADGGRRRIEQLEAQLLEALNADTRASPVDVRGCRQRCA